MNVPSSDGRVVLNVEGKQYVASFRIERGVITVTSGATSRIVEVGEVEDPKSVARTVLRSMVTEGSAATASSPVNAARLRHVTERLAFGLPYSHTRH